MKMLFLLRCPKCRNEMKYQAAGVLGKQLKKCVYCGKAFKVRDSVVSRL
jgi:uncharacterized protein YbaR (Trm112 family)